MIHFLYKNDLESVVLPIDGKNHLYVKFPANQYNPLFKILHQPIYYSAWGCVLYNDIIKKNPMISNIEGYFYFS